jgi:hypothetical protein
MARIKVKLGAAEAEVEADLEHMKEAIDLIPEVLAKLPRVGSEAAKPAILSPEPARASTESERVAPPSSLPMVSIEKSDSLADVIGKFFADQWGREKRKLSDVRSALQSYGLNYPKQSVAVALLRLAKTTKIRRFKAEDGEYVYTSSVPYFVQPAPQPESAQDSSG